MGKKWKMWGLIEIKIKYIRSSWNKSKVLDEIETPHKLQGGKLKIYPNILYKVVRLAAFGPLSALFLLRWLKEKIKLKGICVSKLLQVYNRAGTAYWQSNFLRWPNRAQMGLRKDRLGLTSLGLVSLGLTRLPLAIVLFFNCCLLYLFNAYIIN